MSMWGNWGEGASIYDIHTKKGEGVRKISPQPFGQTVELKFSKHGGRVLTVKNVVDVIYGRPQNDICIYDGDSHAPASGIPLSFF